MGMGLRLAAFGRLSSAINPFSTQEACVLFGQHQELRHLARPDGLSMRRNTRSPRFKDFSLSNPANLIG